MEAQNKSSVFLLSFHHPIIDGAYKDTDFPPEQEIPQGLFSGVKDGIWGDLRMPIQAILGRTALCLKLGRPYDLSSGGLRPPRKPLFLFNN